MDRMKNLLGGPGFYAALALCVLAVGAGGFFLLRREEPVEAMPIRRPLNLSIM